MPPKPFKPYGNPPPLDIDEYKDSFELWLRQWEIFLHLSTINTVLPQTDRPEYTSNILLSCLSKPTLKAVLTMGLGPDELKDPIIIIEKLKERCNAGRNRHVWRQQFAARSQRESESADGWLSDLRDLARKCEFEEDCCAKCQDTRLLGQVVFGVFDDEVRRRILEQGDKLSLDAALAILRTAEATKQQAANIRHSGTSTVNQVKAQGDKQHGGRPDGHRRETRHEARPSRWHPPGCQPYGCWNCGAATRHNKEACPAFGKECNSCHKTGHFQSVCARGSGSREKTETAGSISINSISADDMVQVSISPVGGSSTVVLSALPDSGASIDGIPAGMYWDRFKNTPLSNGTVKVVTATGSPITSVGNFRASILWHDGHGAPVPTVFHVLQDLQQPVISKGTQKKLGMLHAEYPHPCLVATVSPPSVPPVQPSVQQSKLSELMAEYPSIFDGICRPMRGPPCRFTVKEGAVPSAVRGSRPVAVPLMQKLKLELDSLEDQMIISKVTEPTVWVHPIVIVPKDNGGIRICGDFTSLNRWIIRPTFDAPTPFQAVRTIPPGMKFFTVIDALKGYHQVLLDDESSAMTTFSTPFGRYKYNRLPFGVSLAGDDYGRRLAEIFDGFPNYRRVVEDILVFSETWEEHVDLVRRLFHLAAEHNIAINVGKIVFGQPSVLFGGYVVSENGFRPSPDLLKAIQEFPTPTCVSEMRAFQGLCQQVGNFSDGLAALLRPLAPLLRKDFLWEWTEQHDVHFKTARASLSSTATLSFYDPDRPTALHVDASRLRGLGFILRQQNKDGSWNVVQAGSRFLSDAETRYAMIELECLAAAWAMRKCRQFLEGLPSFQLLTDHRPLIPILNDYHLDKLDNPRILRLRLSMQRYVFSASWVPGKENVMADALSRSPVDQPSAEDEMAEGPQSFAARVNVVDTMEGSSDARPDRLLLSVASAVAADPVMTALRKTILHGFPNEKCNLPMELRPFWHVRSQLSIDDTDGLILVGARVVIPASLRQEIINRLLQMHQGATKIRQRARQSVYWPSMDNDVITAARSCQSCTELLPSYPSEPLQPHEPATRPFEFVFADLCTFRGRDFLVVADQYSGWPQVYPFPDNNTSSRRIIDALRSFFTCGAGAPVKLWSDGGPQFKSDEYLTFLREWDISHGRSSPYHPRSNGHVEAAVKSMKKLIASS